MAKRRIHFYLEKEVWEQLRDIASKHNVSAAEIMRLSIKEGIERNKNKILEANENDVYRWV